MQTPIDFGKEYLDTFYHKQDTEAALSFLADDLVYVSQDEVYHFRSSKEIYAFLKSAILHDPSSYVDIISIKSPPGAGDTVTVLYEVNIVPKGAAVGAYRRILLVIRRDISQEIICVNISAPYAATLASALGAAATAAVPESVPEEAPAGAKSQGAAAGSPAHTGNTDAIRKEAAAMEAAVKEAEEKAAKEAAEKEAAEAAYKEAQRKIRKLSAELEAAKKNLSETQGQLAEARSSHDEEVTALKEQAKEREEDIRRQAQTELDLFQAQLRGESASRQARLEWELSGKYMKKERELALNYDEKEKEFREKVEGFEEAIRQKDEEIGSLGHSLKDAESALQETRRQTEEERRELENAISELKKEASAAGDRMEILRSESKRQESLYARTSAIRDSADAEVRKALHRIERFYGLQEIPVISKKFSESFEQLLDMARVIADREPLREKNFSFYEMMGTLTALTGADCRKSGMLFAAELPEKDLKLNGDPARILQILFNIFEEMAPARGAADAAVNDAGSGAAVRGTAQNASAGTQQDGITLKVTADRPVRGRTYLNFMILDPTGEIRTALKSPDLEVTTQLIGMMGGSIQVRSQHSIAAPDAVQAVLKLNIKTGP